MKSQDINRFIEETSAATAEFRSVARGQALGPLGMVDAALTELKKLAKVAKREEEREHNGVQR